jgi:hypothetical protein
LVRQFQLIKSAHNKRRWFKLFLSKVPLTCF